MHMNPTRETETVVTLVAKWIVLLEHERNNKR